MNAGVALQIAKRISSNTEVDLRFREMTKRAKFQPNGLLWTTMHVHYHGFTYDESHYVEITYNENYYEDESPKCSFSGKYTKKGSKRERDLSSYDSLDDLIQRLNTVFPNTLVTNP